VLRGVLLMIGICCAAFATGRRLPAAEARELPAAGAAVDIAQWASVRTWTGPFVKYSGTGDVGLQTPSAPPLRGGAWALRADRGERSVNIGLVWDEPRNPRTVVIVYADAASAPRPEAQELQAWLHPERPLAGGESPWQGHWRALKKSEGLSVAVDGLTWTYRLPDIPDGIFQFRIVLKDHTAARVRSLRATGAAKWRPAEFEVRFDPPREAPSRRVEGYNAEVTGVEPIPGGDGLRVRGLASDASSDSGDAAIFTIRAGDRSFSFLANDLDADGVMRVTPFGATVAKPGAKPIAASEKTIGERVVEMPEQTFDRVLNAIPPKQRTKWLALAPPLNPRKFAVKPNGDIFARDEWDLNYQFATGDKPDYERREPQHVEEDHLPVLYADWDDGGLRWQQGYVVTALGGRFDDPTQETALVTRISASNDGAAPVAAKLWLCLRTGTDECADVRLDGNLLIEGKRVRALLDPAEWQVRLEDRQIVLTATVPDGETRALELEIPFSASEQAPERVPFDTARRQTIEYWRARLAQGADFAVPDPRVNALWRSLLIHQYCWGDYDAQSGSYRPNVAAFSYGPVGNESSQMGKALDYFGHARLAADYYQTMWEKQGADALAARTTNGDGALPGWWGSYVFNTGFILWNLGNHYRLTGDRAWLDQVIPHMITACDWLAEQRRTTVGTDTTGAPLMESGFFPPCGLEDEGRWFYWVMTNGYLYLGMTTVADLLAEIGHPDAQRIAAEAAAYLTDLRRGIGESTVRCPVMKLRDGSYVPYLPKHLYRRGRSEGHYEGELGALHLLTTNVYAPDSREMDWTVEYLEDVVFMTEAPSHDSIISYRDMERDWFDLGGYPKTQPYLLHTQIAYLRRDQPKLFLRSFWNQLVAQNYRDINAFPEHICWHGAADCKTYEEAMWLQQFRCMLVFDEDNRLLLCGAAPREWFEDGKTIEVSNAPTDFGPVSYQIRSHAAEGTITAQVRFSARRQPGKLLLRLRHPSEAKLTSVTVNGRPWAAFDAARETIELPMDQGKLEVVARY
jgi:hypothetical protein